MFSSSEKLYSAFKKDETIPIYLYSSVCGKCKLVELHVRLRMAHSYKPTDIEELENKIQDETGDDTIIYQIMVEPDVFDREKKRYTFDEKGRLDGNPDGECLLFPSIDEHDWNNF